MISLVECLTNFVQEFEAQEQALVKAKAEAAALAKKRMLDEARKRAYRAASKNQGIPIYDISKSGIATPYEAKKSHYTTPKFILNERGILVSNPLYKPRLRRTTKT